jgi:hypothetical protein
MQRKIITMKARACAIAAMLLAVCAAGLTLYAANETREVNVEVRGLRVVGEAYGDSMQGLRAFNWSKGTSLALLAVFPEGGIISFDSEASKLERFGDDKGTNLLEEPKSGESTFFQSKPGFGMMASVSEDGKACMIELDSPAVPAKGAARIDASGSLVFKCGSKKKTFTHENVAFKVGTKVEAGAVPLEVTKVGEPEWGDDPLQITLKATQDMSKVAAIAFFDGNGNAIESSDAGWTSMRSFNVVSIEKSFNLKKKVDSATIAVTYWVDMRDEEIPFKVTASLGL